MALGSVNAFEIPFLKKSTNSASFCFQEFRQVWGEKHFTEVWVSFLFVFQKIPTILNGVGMFSRYRVHIVFKMVNSVICVNQPNGGDFWISLPTIRHDYGSRRYVVIILRLECRRSCLQEFKKMFFLSLMSMPPNIAKFALSSVLCGIYVCRSSSCLFWRPYQGL